MKHLFLDSALCSEAAFQDAISALLEHVGHGIRFVLVDSEGKQKKIPGAIQRRLEFVETIRGMANLCNGFAALVDQGVRPCNMLYLARDESDVRQLKSILDEKAPLT